MIEGRWKWGAYGAPMLLAILTLLSSSASADPESELSAAESRAAAAATGLAAARNRLDAARTEYAAASRRARPVAAAARSAQAEARELTAQLVVQRQQARAEIADAQSSHRQEVEDHDDEVANELGIGLAMLAAAAIALGWGWFRSSPAVAALVGMRLSQAVALCVGGGFLILVIGAALPETGFAGAIGTLLVCLGLILPVALLLARHSIEVRQGNSQSIVGRERMSDRGSRAAALLLFLFALIALVGAIASDEPTAPVISAQLREEAKPIDRGPGADRLEEARTRAAKARKRAVVPVNLQSTAQTALQKAADAVTQTKSRLVEAEADVTRSERQLAALIAREEREAARQAEREAEEAEEIEEEELEFFEEEEAASGCDPNYSGCVPAYPPDVDCAEVGGSVSVYGTDPHGLDADSDGVGCE